MFQKINKCYKCKERNEASPFFGKHLTDPYAMAINLQVGGLCEECQKPLLEAVERVVVDYVKK
jgi:hypothetical protein